MEDLLSQSLLFVIGALCGFLVVYGKSWLSKGAPVPVPGGVGNFELLELAEVLRTLARTAVAAAEQLGIAEDLEALGVEVLERGQSLGKAKYEWAYNWIVDQLDSAGYGWVPMDTIKAYIEEAVLALVNYTITLVEEPDAPAPAPSEPQ